MRYKFVTVGIPGLTDMTTVQGLGQRWAIILQLLADSPLNLAFGESDQIKSFIGPHVVPGL